MQDQIDRDLKSALLSGDKLKAETLKGLKNSLQYESVNQGAGRSTLPDEQIIKVFQKESKKRQEAAELYQKAGEVQRAQAELTEKAVIDGYLPAQLDENEVAKVVNEEIDKLGSPTIQDMGRIIGSVRNRLPGQADGALIAKIVKERLK